MKKLMMMVAAEALAAAGLTGFAADRIVIAERGKSAEYRVVLPADPSPSQVTAAKELSAYVEQMTGVRLPVETNTAPKKAIYLGNGAEGLGNDGFRLRTTPPHLRIEGGRVHGTLFGVYDFLERYCGCEWLSPTTSVIPKLDRIAVAANLDDTQKPAFPLRDMNWTAQLSDWGFTAKLKMNGFRTEYPEELGGQDHRKDTTTGGATFDNLCPPATIKGHPEWFSLVNGRRLTDRGSQRCLTNTEFLEFLVRQMRERIRKNYPQCKYYSIYPNDCQNNCQCESCKALDEREGTPMASLLHMANYVADRVRGEWPDVNILTFAYSYSLTPPKTMKVHDNVMIVYCTDRCEFSRSFTESRWQGNRRFVREFRRWRELTDRLYIWDYSANFRQRFQPFECCHVLPDNFRLCRDIGVVGVFEEGDHYRTHCVDEALKTWIIGHLLWNPDQRLEPLLNRFFRGYYGAAANTARAYYDALLELEGKRDETKVPMLSYCINDVCHPYEFFVEWSRKWNAAMETVKDDPIRRENVYWARHNVDLARLMLSKWSERFSLLSSNFNDDPESAELTGIARRILADFDRVKGLNDFRDDKDTRARVNMVVSRADGKAPDAGRTTVPAEDLRVEDPSYSSLVNDPAAIGGKAIRFEALAKDGRHHLIAFREYAFRKDAGARIRLRVHAKVERTGERDGTAFTVGTCDMGKRTKCDIADYHVPISQVKGDGYAWYDVEGVWRPTGGETIWIGNGERTDGVNRCIKAVYVDQIELVLDK